MITITNIENAAYKSDDGNIIDVDITTDEYGVMPTTIIVNSNEQDAHILQIKEWLTTADISPFVPAPPETPAQSDLRKDSQVDEELGADSMRILIETLLPYIDAGLNPVDIINEAKSKRRLEL